MLQALAAAALLALGAVSTTATTVSYSGNSSTTAFATGFKFISSSDLVVTKTTSGVTTTLVLGVGYTVTGAGSNSGGTVTCTVAPATGSTLTIARVTPVTQTLTLQHQGALPITSMQNALDKSIMVSQEINAAATSLTSRVGTLETDETDHESRISTLEGYNISSRLTLLESSVSTLLTASGFDLGAIYAAAHSWTAQQTFSSTGALSAVNATGSGAGSGLVASNSGGGRGIHITAGGQLIDSGGLTISAGGLTVTGTTTFTTGVAATQSTPNQAAFSGTGNGLASGAAFVGGSGGGSGVTAQGGASDGAGATFTGGATNGDGVDATASGTGVGAVLTGGSSGGIGMKGLGGGTAAGGYFSNGTAATGGTRRNAVTITNGDIDMDSVTAPTSTTGAKNKLTPANIVKAWANVSEGASPAVAGGFNVASASCASNQITVTFATAMADANYSAQAIRVGASATMWIAQQTTTTVKLAALDDAGAAINLCAGAQKVNVTVVGLQ